jgi:Domain of unknown function (DUF4349)
MLRRGRFPVLLLLVVVAGWMAAACGSGSRSPGAASRPVAAAPTAAGPEVGGQGQDSRLSARAGGVGIELTAVGPKIIKTASISLEIKDQTYEQRSQDVTLIASRHGGFVTSSRTAGQQHLSGTMVVRVPASQFEGALGELKALGTVTGEQIAGEDVTAQFVDLQARLTNWEAQEAVLLKLMAQSTSIEDSLKVQQTLQDVQLAIEEIKGQLRVLSDQTDMSTITVSMAEKAVALRKKPAGNAFVRAWRNGVDALVAVFTALAIGVGFLAPLLLIALAAALGWAVFRRLRPKEAVAPVSPMQR